MIFNDALNLLYISISIPLLLISLCCCISPLILCIASCVKSGTKYKKTKLELVRYHDTTKHSLCEFEDLNIQTNPIVSSKADTYIYYHFDHSSTSTGTFNDEFIKIHEFFNILISANIADTTDIILHISSPGGTASDFEKLYTRIKSLRALNYDFTALVDGYCCSGGYMIACACNRIVASETAQIGSIGVFAIMPNFKEISDKIGIKAKTFKTTANKSYPMFEDSTEDDDKNIQDHIEYTFKYFKEIIISNRPSVKIDEVANAKVWYGRDALNLNLIDTIASKDIFISDIAKSSELLIATMSIVSDKSKGLNNLGTIDIIKKVVSLFKKLFSFYEHENLLPI